MDKKIGSVIKIKNDEMNLELCTLDKKNPRAMYFCGGAYITPINTQINYKENIVQLEEMCNNTLERMINTTNSIKKDKYYLFFDVADSRIEYGKKTYLSFEFHFKPSDELFSTPSSFKEKGKKLCETYENYTEKYASIIKSCGFNLSKTKQ